MHSLNYFAAAWPLVLGDNRISNIGTSRNDFNVDCDGYNSPAHSDIWYLSPIHSLNTTTNTIEIGLHSLWTSTSQET